MNQEQKTDLSVIDKSLEFLTAILLFAMMLLTFIDVIGRYIFNSPVYGAAEIIQMLLAGVIFSALPLVTRRDSHISVELFSPSISKKIPKTHCLIINLFSIIGLLIIGYELIRNVIEAHEIGRETIVLEWPLLIVLIPSAFFCLVAVCAQCIWLKGVYK